MYDLEITVEQQVCQALKVPCIKMSVRIDGLSRTTGDLFLWNDENQRASVYEHSMNRSKLACWMI